MHRSRKRVAAATGVCLVLAYFMTRFIATERHSRFSVEQTHAPAARELVRRFDGQEVNALAPFNWLIHGLYAHQGDYFVTLGPLKICCLTWLWWMASNPVPDVAALTETMDGWSFSEAEAHRGQFLFKLDEAGVDFNRAEMFEFNGKFIPLSALVTSMEKGISDVADLDYVLPTLLRHGRSSWANRYSEVWTIDRLVQTHLDHRGTARTCLGAHWRIALAYLVRDHPTTIKPATLGRAESMLLAECEQVLQGQSGSGMFALPETSRSLSPTIVLSFHAHTLEWMLIASEALELHDKSSLAAAMQWLITESNALWSRCDYLTKCHCARACRRYLELTRQ